MTDATVTALTTARQALRRFRPEDLDAFAAYRSDPEVARYQSWEVPYQLSQARQFLREMEAIHPDTPGEWFQFAVTLRGTDRLIGDGAAHVDADDPRQAEIGFTLASEHQGHGYATEAVRRLLHHLLVERGKHRVSATCDARNTHAQPLCWNGWAHRSLRVRSPSPQQVERAWAARPAPCDPRVVADQRPVTISACCPAASAGATGRHLLPVRRRAGLPARPGRPRPAARRRRARAGQWRHR
jgi:RimJ/RimL family protein N-acetyltransferase